MLRINREIRLGFLYSFLTLVLLGLIFKFGILAAVQVAEFLQGKEDVPTGGLTDDILSPPQLFSLPEATNSATLVVSGYAQPNSEIDIYLNELNVQTLESDSEGKFETDISLSLGVSKIYAVVKNAKDQLSPPSRAWEVFYEKSAPMLEILEPEEGSLIRKNPSVYIKGKVAKTTKVTINDHLAILDSEGYFNYPVKLGDGENKFMIVATDPAQNKTEKEFILHYQR